VPEAKATRVARFQEKTVHSAREILGAAGFSSPGDIGPDAISVRTSTQTVHTYEELYYSDASEKALTKLMEKGKRYLRQ